MTKAELDSYLERERNKKAESLGYSRKPGTVEITRLYNYALKDSISIMVDLLLKEGILTLDE